VSSTRIRRKDLRQPDEFIEVTGRAWQWLLANRRGVSILAGAALALLIGAVGVREFRDARARGAAETFRKAATLLAEGEDAAAVQVLEEVKPVGAYGALAELYRGYAALQANDPAKAGAVFVSVAERVELPAYLRQEALYNLAFAESLQGKNAEALERYRAAADLPGPFGVDALLNAGALSSAAGRVDVAREFYERAVSDAQVDGEAQEDLRRVAERRLTGLAP
jgi:hypothetical protein